MPRPWIPMVFFAILRAGNAEAELRHGGQGSAVLDDDEPAAQSAGSITFIPAGAKPDSGDGGEPVKAKKRAVPGPPVAVPATELTLVLYAKANEAPGKAVTERLRRSETLVVPVTPLDRKHFKASVERARRTFLDNWWSFPQRVSVVVVSPEQPADGIVISDDPFPWPLRSLQERDIELRAIFRDRLPRPRWLLALPVAISQRCRLPLVESAGLLVGIPKFERSDRFSRFMDILSWPTVNLNGDRFVIQDPVAPQIYHCHVGEDPPWYLRE